MTYQKKPFLPYLLLSFILAFCTHRAYALYSLAPEPNMTDLFGQYTYVLEHYFDRPIFLS